MKIHTILISLSISLFGPVFGQGNLQFNQVKLVGGTSETVPTGKVWKIESAPITLRDGIQVMPRFMIGSDTILLACCDSYNVSQLENVVSVRLQWKGENSGVIPDYNIPWTQNGANNVAIKINGVKYPSQPFEQTLSYSNVPAGNSQDFINLGSAIPLSSNSNQINSFSISFVIQSFNLGGPFGFYFAPCNYTFLATFFLANGNSFSYSISSLGGPSSSSPQYTVVAQGPVIPTEIRERKTETQFPIWIPAGTAVKTLSNIGKLSILEFNVAQ